MKTLVRVFTFACAAVLIASQILVAAQGPQLDPTQPGALYGYTATDLDAIGGVGHKVYRVRLTDGVSVERGFTGVTQEQEGLYSIDNVVGGFSNLFGIGENPDTTGSTEKSNRTDLTLPALNPAASGSQLNLTGIETGTEIGAAYDPTNIKVWVAASDDRNPAFTQLFELDPGTGTVVEARPRVDGIYVDGLAVGRNGALFGSDCRLQDRLYQYDFDADDWVTLAVAFTPEVGTDFAEDSGLATYINPALAESDPNKYTLYMITEGEDVPAQGIVRVGRLWRIVNDGSGNPTGENIKVGEIRLGTGAEVPEDLEGFDIPFLPLQGQQPE